MPEDPLDWFPKRFAAGDMAGQGAQRLLGQSNLNRAELLVREMAQNSWDARLPNAVPTFELHLRTLSTGQRDLLRNLLREGDGGSLGLHDALSLERLRVIEVHDRGTKGLGGPVRNDIVPSEGEATDFADFVLTLGAPRDKELGGGTFGFGKTAAYTASSCGTVVIWTRTRAADGDLQHRLIVSAFGDAFDMDGVRYTGRHWWGRGRDGSVEPIVGAPAERLGTALYARCFDPEESGTSLMILAPQITDGDESDLVEAWRQSIQVHLWPKLVPDQPASRTMTIAIRHDDRAVSLHMDSDRPLLQAKGEALAAIRAIQAGAELPDTLVRVAPIERQKPRKVLGHIAFAFFTDESGIDDKATGPQLDDGRNSVILMRHEAELVVKQLPGDPLSSGTIQWVGVFKPTAGLDDSFAAAEPPSHDDWAPGGLPREQRLDVRYTLDSISQHIRDFVTPAGPPARTSRGVSAGQVSTALAALAGVESGGRATGTTRGARKEPTGGRATGGGNPRSEITSWTLVPPPPSDHRPERRTYRVTIAPPQHTGACTITPVIAFGAEGGSVTALEDGVVAIRWEGIDITTPGGSVRAAEGTTEMVALIEAPSDIALDISFRTEVEQ